MLHIKRSRLHLGVPCTMHAVSGGYLRWCGSQLVTSRRPAPARRPGSVVPRHSARAHPHRDHSEHGRGQQQPRHRQLPICQMKLSSLSSVSCQCDGVWSLRSAWSPLLSLMTGTAAGRRTARRGPRLVSCRGVWPSTSPRLRIQKWPQSRRPLSGGSLSGSRKKILPLKTSKFHHLYLCFSDVRIDNSGGDLQQDREEPGAASPAHKDSTSIKKEIIGILKPPTLKKELKSFPSLPECFLHDLGLLDNLALRYFPFVYF